MIGLLALFACGDGTAEVRADLEAKGLTVLEVKLVESEQGELFEYAGTRDGQFCMGDVGRSGSSLGCASSTNSLTTEVCSDDGGLFAQAWRCDHLSVGTACNDAGVILAKDGKPEGFERVVRGCNLGFADACRNAGVIVNGGLAGQAADPFAAATWFERACYGGSGIACKARGTLLKTPASPFACGTAAGTWFERGVALNNADSCNELGLQLNNCENGDKVRARAMFKAACDGGEVAGCSNLGSMRWAGHGGDVDVPGALSAWETGCTSKEPSVKACIKRANNGPPAEATVWLGKACDAGDLDACLDFGVGLIKANVNDQGSVMLAAFQKACDGANATGCRNIGVVRRDGLLGLEKSKDEAHAMFVKACDMGDAPACRELKK